MPRSITAAPLWRVAKAGDDPMLDAFVAARLAALRQRLAAANRWRIDGAGYELRPPLSRARDLLYRGVTFELRRTPGAPRRHARLAEAVTRIAAAAMFVLLLLSGAR